MKQIIKLGRPKSIDSKDIISRCCQLFWQKGINNVSFNDAIRYSNVSKGSVYNYFSNLDSLHKATFDYYYTNYISEMEQNIIKYNDVFEALAYLDKKVLKIDYRPCYFFVSLAIKCQLGKKTTQFLEVIECKLKELWKKLLTRHINKRKLNKELININAIATFLIHNFTLMNILISNKTRQKDLKILQLSIKNKILQDLNFKIA